MPIPVTTGGPIAPPAPPSSPSPTGEPNSWTYFGKRIRLHPVPDGEYTIRLQLGPYRLAPILDLSNAPVRISETETLTLKSVATSALLSAHRDDDGMPGDEKAKRFVLALTIEQASAPIDIKAEDVVTLKKLIGRNYAPLVVGRAYELLD